MLDTIVLKLSRDDFKVIDPDRFTPSARHLFCPPYAALKGGGIFRYIQNPTKAEKHDGIYRPRLTIIKGAIFGGYTLDLRIEFSAPKLLFGNNFDELDEGDFEAVLAILSQRLHEMGVEVQAEVLRLASVSAIHFSKNIILKEHATSSQVISAIYKLDLNARLDLNKTIFRNGGRAVSFHANSYEVTFYDKIKDLAQARISPKRAIDGNDAYLIFGELPQDLEVLRIEIRLGRRAKIAHLFNKLAINSPIRFNGIFKKDIAQKIIICFWEQIEKDLDLIQMSSSCPEDIFLATQKNGKLKTNKVLQLIGALTLGQSVGLRGLRALTNNGNAQAWPRLRKELESLPKTGMEKLSSIKQIRDSLVDFYPLRSHSYYAIPFDIEGACY